MDSVSHPASLNQTHARATLGVFLVSLVDLYHTLVLDVMVNAARKKGLSVVAYLGGEIESEVPDNVNLNIIYRLAHAHNMDGLFLTTHALMRYIDIPQMAAFCDQYAVPKISLGVTLPNASSILVDNAPGMRDLVRHLIEVHGLPLKVHDKL